MRSWTSRIGAPLGIILLVLSPAAALAPPLGPALVTPALLSLNSLAASSTPQLRVVSEAFSRDALAEKKFASGFSMPSGIRTGSDRPFVHRGVEVLARYSYSRVDQSPTPWQEGTEPLSLESQHDRDERYAAGSATVRIVTQDASGAVAYSATRTLDAHAGIAWSAPNPHSSSSLQNIGETSSLSIIRTLVRVANPVLEMADGLRALRLNEVRVGDGLILKLDGRTGRHARCFAILTQRF